MQTYFSGLSLEQFPAPLALFIILPSGQVGPLRILIETLSLRLRFPSMQTYFSGLSLEQFPAPLALFIILPSGQVSPLRILIETLSLRLRFQSMAAFSLWGGLGGTTLAESHADIPFLTPSGECAKVA